MVCSFFGHKDTPTGIYPQLLAYIEYLIKERSVSRYIVGNQGGFDSMVLKALRELKRRYPYICYHVILAYMPVERQKYEAYDVQETVFPEEVEKAPKRFAISRRNQWMVQKSQIVVCYITHSWGGAAQSVENAKKQGKEVINLADEYEA